MRAADVRNWLDTRFFRPFRIYLTNGHAFDIRHPTQVSIGSSTATIQTASADILPAPEVEVSLVHITHLEPISPSTSPSSN